MFKEPKFNNVISNYKKMKLISFLSYHMYLTFFLIFCLFPYILFFIYKNWIRTEYLSILLTINSFLAKKTFFKFSNPFNFQNHNIFNNLYYYSNLTLNYYNLEPLHAIRNNSFCEYDFSVINFNNSCSIRKYNCLKMFDKTNSFVFISDSNTGRKSNEIFIEKNWNVTKDNIGYYLYYKFNDDRDNFKWNWCNCYEYKTMYENEEFQGYWCDDLEKYKTRAMITSLNHNKAITNIDVCKNKHCSLEEVKRWMEKNSFKLYNESV